METTETLATPAETSLLTTGHEDGQESASPAWISELPDDVREAKTWNRFSQDEDTNMVSVPEAVLKTHLSLESMLGDRNKMPETPEEQIELHTKLGWEKDFDTYSEGIERVEMPEGVEYDTAEEEYLLQIAHEAHVPVKVAQEQYNKIVEAKLGKLKDTGDASETYLAKVEEDFKTKYQGDLDVMKNRAMLAMKEKGNPELVNLFETAEVDGRKLGDHPAMFEFMAALGKDHIGTTNERGDNNNVEDSASIQEQISAEMAKPAYFDGNHVEHKSSVAKVSKLYQRLHGEI